MTRENQNPKAKSLSILVNFDRSEFVLIICVESLVNAVGDLVIMASAH